jgi:hypothetical protein
MPSAASLLFLLTRIQSCPDPQKTKPQGLYAELTIFKVTAWTLCHKFLLDFYSDPSVRRINRRCLDAARLTPKSGRLPVFPLE